MSEYVVVAVIDVALINYVTYTLNATESSTTPVDCSMTLIFNVCEPTKELSVVLRMICEEAFGAQLNQGLQRPSEDSTISKVRMAMQMLGLLA